jgi:hypothetical protein
LNVTSDGEGACAAAGAQANTMPASTAATLVKRPIGIAVMVGSSR